MRVHRRFSVLLAITWIALLRSTAAGLEWERADTPCGSRISGWGILQHQGSVWVPTDVAIIEIRGDLCRAHDEVPEVYSLASTGDVLTTTH